MSEVACWPNGYGRGFWVRVRVRAGARECITLVPFFFLCLTKCGENLVFVGWVSPWRCHITWVYSDLVNKFSPVRIRCVCQSHSSLASLRAWFCCIFDWSQPALLLRVLCCWRKLSYIATALSFCICPGPHQSSWRPCFWDHFWITNTNNVSQVYRVFLQVIQTHHVMYTGSLLVYTCREWWCS